MTDTAAKMQRSRNDVRTYKGIGVSPGIAIGRAVIIERREASIFRVPIREEDVVSEVNRFLEALKQTRDELAELAQKVSRSMGDEYASIFEAHAMMVSDPSFADKVVQKIESEQVNAEWALAEVQEELQARFQSFDDEYLREREADVKDVADRVQTNLQGIAHHDLSEIKHDVIILADDLTPSGHDPFQPPADRRLRDRGRRADVAYVDHRQVAVHAGRHRRAAPDEDRRQRRDGDRRRLRRHVLIVNPTQAMIAEYQSRVLRHEEAETKSSREPHAAGGHQGQSPDHAAGEHRARRRAQRCDSIRRRRHRPLSLGISLHLEKPAAADRRRASATLSGAGGRLAPRDCVIRTFDLGGKKLAREVIGSREDNPVLGLRGLRLCMKHRDMFSTQLRALLRASVVGNIKIMFPLVSGVQELRQVKSLIREVKEDLDSEGLEYNPKLKIGIMIEVPSAALIADILAQEADFFAIGTNDLIQYSLAIDRSNENVSYLYEPLHPALLRLIKGVIDAGKKAGIPVSMCGEMASDPIYAVVLIGLGLEIFSMNPSSIPIIKNIARSVRYRDCRRIAELALQKKTAQEIEEFVIESVAMRFPEGLINKSV